jgi:hypothetical protein
MGGIQKKLREKVYIRDAITPQFGWIISQQLSSPEVRVSRDRQLVRATWTERGKGKAFWFVVYAKDKDGWSYSVLPASERSIALSSDRRIEEIVVTSVDRLGNESR